MFIRYTTEELRTYREALENTKRKPAERTAESNKAKKQFDIDRKLPKNKKVF